LLPAGTLAEAHDLSRLVHFPVPLPTLAISSLIANLAQPLVLARLPILAALALGLAGGAGSLPFCLAGLALAFALILAGGQAVGLVLHAFSRNRRLHDVALFLGLGLGFLLSVAPILLAYPERGGSTWRVWCDWCERWHIHSPEEGHRVAHCPCYRSPYSTTGYVLLLATGPAPRRRQKPGSACDGRGPNCINCPARRRKARTS
jgi:hypothetical protein